MEACHDESKTQDEGNQAQPKQSQKRAKGKSAQNPLRAQKRANRSASPSVIIASRISITGLRPYSAYRDLGIAPATSGLVQAHVIRMTKPFDAQEVAIPHYHDVEFQMIYVLKGWFQSEFEGQGVHTFHAGSCWIQPPKIKHTVRGYSDDCELLEIVLPANFDTVTLR